MKNDTIAIIFDYNIPAVKRCVEPLQYALFGLGYKWFCTGKNVPIPISGNQIVIFVNLKSKLLCWEEYNLKWRGHSYVEIRLTAINILDVIDFVKTPSASPKDLVMIEEIKDHGRNIIKFSINTEDKTANVQIITNGYLLSYEEVSSDSMKKVVNALSIEDKPFDIRTLPLIEFSYNNCLRWVRATLINNTYIRGYEIDNKDSDKGQFKSFLKDKISNSSVWVIEFGTKKSP